MNDSHIQTSANTSIETATKSGRQSPCTLVASLTNGLYYLGLGTWFGAIVMLAIGAAATFQTVRAYEPTLHVAPWNQPELVDHAPTVLAGAIVGASLNGLRVMQIICAIIVCVALIAQHTIFRQYLNCKAVSIRNIVRLILVTIPVLVLLVNIFWITPNILNHRDAMWDMNQTSQVRDQAKANFDRFHKLSERTVGFAAFALAGCVLVSSLVLGNTKQQPRQTY